MDITSSVFWLQIGLASLCGLLIGLERQVRGKPVGVRTSMMICLGATIFVQLTSGVEAGNVDPTRVIGQVATGVGFLGAGVIMTQSGLVVGMTSASVIWMLAAIGCTIGSDNLGAAMVFTGISLFVLIGMDLLERSLRALRRGFHANQPVKAEAAESPGHDISDS